MMKKFGKGYVPISLNEVIESQQRLDSFFFFLKNFILFFCDRQQGTLFHHIGISERLKHKDTQHQVGMMNTPNTKNLKQQPLVICLKKYPQVREVRVSDDCHAWK